MLLLFIRRYWTGAGLRTACKACGLCWAIFKGKMLRSLPTFSIHVSEGVHILGFVDVIPWLGFERQNSPLLVEYGMEINGWGNYIFVFICGGAKFWKPCLFFSLKDSKLVGREGSSAGGMFEVDEFVPRRWEVITRQMSCTSGGFTEG